MNPVASAPGTDLLQREPGRYSRLRREPSPYPLPRGEEFARGTDTPAEVNRNFYVEAVKE